jgi:hypothetical protein
VFSRSDQVGVVINQDGNMEVTGYVTGKIKVIPNPEDSSRSFLIRKIRRVMWAPVME